MKSAYFMLGTGLVLMSTGIGGVFDQKVGLMSFVAGFVVMLSGVALWSRKATKAETVSQKRERDSPALIRFTGVAIALLSLITPYYREPVTTEMQGLSVSFMELVAATYSTGSVEVSYLFVALVSVVLVGSFVSIFHHAGGYIMLLGSMTVLFVGMMTLGSLEGLVQHVEAGIVLMVLAALVVVSSRLSHPDTGFREGSDWVMSSVVR
ncbi:MAG: hypothetical protein ACLFMT_02335 [Halobacteriales archaeon]